MTDHERIERELHDAAGEIRVDSGVSSSIRRRIKLRRIGTVTTGLGLVVALAFGATFAAGAFTSETSKIGPAQPTDPPLLIDYKRAGGYEGSEIHLTIQADGESVVRSDEETVSYTMDGRLSADEMAGLEAAIDAVDWADADGVHEPPPGVGVADGYQYELRHDSFIVLTESAADPPEGIADLITYLDRFLEGRSASDPCGPPVDFEPTYLPDGWSKHLQPGSGEGQDYPGLVGHFGSARDARAGYFNMFAGLPPFAQSNRQTIEVLGLPATSGDIHEGYSVEFKNEGCTYTLIAYGFERAELERFAEDLRLKSDADEPSEPENFAAIWPEDSEGRAGEECTSIQHIDGHWRSDAIRTAERFTTEVLGWEEAQATQSKREGGFYVYVGNGPISSDTPTVVVYVEELFGGCWSVISVSRLPEEQPKEDGSMSVRGRGVTAGFDMAGASSATFEVGYGGETTRYEWAKGDEMPAVFVLDFEPRGTGHFLVLLRDENGEVFSAFGSALPAGDFAAG